MGAECHFEESPSLLAVIGTQPLCSCFSLMVHFHLLRDEITRLRNTQKEPSSSFSFFSHIHKHTPIFFKIYLFTGMSSLFNYRLSSQLKLIGSKSQRLLAWVQTTECKSLCRSSSSSSFFTSPRCRAFTYTEHLLNLHWQPANTEHLQQPRLSASLNNTHHRVPDCTHFFIRMHTHTRIHTHWYECTVVVNTLTSLWQTLDLTAGIKLSFRATDLWLQQSFMQFSLSF